MRRLMRRLLDFKARYGAAERAKAFQGFVAPARLETKIKRIGSPASGAFFYFLSKVLFQK